MTQDPGASAARASAGAFCTVHVVRTEEAVDVIGEAHLGDDLAPLRWTIESFPIGGGDLARVAAVANRAARDHTVRMPRVKVVAIHELVVEA